MSPRRRPVYRYEVVEIWDKPDDPAVDNIDIGEVLLDEDRPDPVWHFIHMSTGEAWGVRAKRLGKLEGSELEHYWRIREAERRTAQR